MNKFLAVASLVLLASPAFAQGMTGPTTADGMSGPSHMANDSMKMDHKKPVKKPAMKKDSMGMPAPSGGMPADKMAAPHDGMNSGSMSGPNH